MNWTCPEVNHAKVGNARQEVQRKVPEETYACGQVNQCERKM